MASAVIHIMTITIMSALASWSLYHMNNHYLCSFCGISFDLVAHDFLFVAWQFDI